MSTFPTITSLRWAIVLLAWLIVMPFAGPLAAQQLEDPRQAVRVRLIDGGWLQGDGEQLRLAGILLELADGWKTYWRVPGEGGVPPRFDLSGSDNVAEARVLWPAPKRFSDPVAGETIGYKHLVVFPVLLKPKDPARPITLRLRMDYGICGQMCVPMRAEETIVLPPDSSPGTADRALLTEWLARTPRATSTAELRVERLRLVQTGNDRVLELTLRGQNARDIEDIFVEGVELAVFDRPRLQPDGKGGLLARIPVRGMAEDADFAAAPLRLTFVLKGEKAVERQVKLP